MVPRSTLLAAVAGALVLGACGSTSKDGKVGDTLSADSLKATVTRVAQKVPSKEGDITGLSTPGPGKRFIGVKVDVCNDSAQAIKPYDFELEPEGGDSVHPRLPQKVFSDDFEGLRDGCERGWMIFEVPEEARPKAVKFKYDDTGSASPGDTEKHVRFRWNVA